MRIIDRYVLWQFTKALLIFFITFSGLFVVIDAFSNLEELINYGRSQGGLLGVIWNYYGARVLALVDLTSGVLALIAAMFTVTALKRQNEMTALMAAGIRKSRIIAPLIGAVIVLSLLAAMSRELLIPALRQRLSRNAQDWLGENARQLEPRYDNHTDIFINGKNTYAQGQRIEQPSFRLPATITGFGRKLTAADAYYQPPQADRPGGYLLKQVQQPADLDKRPSAYLDSRPVILSPADTAWLKPDECFVVSDVSFEQLEGGQSWRQFSSTAELIVGLHNPSLDFGADVRVTVHSRFVQPLLDITLLFLGLPLVLTRQNRSIFVAIGWCLAIVSGFFLLVLACHSLGANYLLSPALAAWCPLIVSVPFAVCFSEPLRE